MGQPVTAGQLLDSISRQSERGEDGICKREKQMHIQACVCLCVWLCIRHWKVRGGPAESCQKLVLDGLHTSSSGVGNQMHMI